MKLKKILGFTLIELLAVILILGIIALIAIPLVGKIIKEARISSEKASFSGIISAIETQKVYTDNVDYNGTKLLEKIDYKGKKPDEISLVVRDENNYVARVVFGDNCYIKIDNDEIEYYATEECPTYNYSDVFKTNYENIQAIIDSETGININEAADYINGKIITKNEVNIYQGLDPANYVAFGGSCFRIVSYDKDNIKIIYDGSNAYQTEANPCSHMYNGSLGRMASSGTIDTLAFGPSQEWLDENNNIRTNFESSVNDTTLSTDDDITLGNENVIKLDKKAKTHLKKTNYYIGGIKEEDTMVVADNAIDNIIVQERTAVYNNYVGLLTLSEYLSGSADPDCKNYKSSTNTCEEDNFLFKHVLTDLTPVFGSWTMNKLINDASESVLYYPFMLYNYNHSTAFRVRPVLTLKGDTLFSGSGTYYNPYTVVN